MTKRAINIEKNIKFLKNYYHSINQLCHQECLLTVEQITDSFKNKIFANSTLHCVAHAGSSLSPSLSASRIKNQTVFFRSLKTLEDFLKEHKAYPFKNASLEGYVTCSSTNYTILLRTPNKILTLEKQKEICKIVNEICELVRSNCLHIKNQERDIQIKKYNYLRAEMKENVNFGLADLGRFIRKKENVSILSIHVCSEFLIDYSNEELKENGHILPASIVNTKSNRYISNFRYLFIESINTGKPMSGYEQVKNIHTYFILIPIIRKTETPYRAKDVLLVYKNSPIRLQSIDFIIECIDMFVSHILSERKLNEIISIQQEVLNIPYLLNRITIDSYSDFRKIFHKFVSLRLDNILSASYAYRAIVRLYEPDNNKLLVFAEANQYLNSEDKLEDIHLRNYRTNVSSFSFLLGTSHKYVYIPKINSPIPKKYQIDGLQKIIRSKEDFGSEICFPLIVGNVPFGVLNLKSDIKNAFDDDIEYLFGIKKVIETFYSNLLHTNDLHWIKSQINRYENIHEIKNDIDIGFFNKEASDRLTKLLLITVKENGSIDYRKENIKDRMEKWIEHMYFTLLEEDRKGIQGIVEYKLDPNVKLHPDLVENAIIILKNLVKNIIAHGNQEKDKIIVSTSPFFKIGDQNILRIYMRTFGIIGLDVIDKIGIVPIIDHTKMPKYGMFLIGMMTRILGGAIFVTREPTIGGFYIIELRIPIYWRDIHE